MPYYVIGHKNPDTDAICSAIGHAALLQLTGETDAQAARCGELSQRTAWVLETAGVPSPKLVMDVRVTAGMISRRNVVSVEPDDTFLTAYRQMLAHGVRSVPVVDAEEKVHGILRYIDLMELLLPAETEGMAVRTVHASLTKVAATLDATVSGGKMPPCREEEDLVLLVGASSQNTVERRLQRAADEGTIGRFLVICGDRPYVHRMAIELGARALLITGGFTIEPELVELATERGVVILRVQQDTASCTTLIRCSRTVRNVLENNFQLITASEPVSRLRKRLAPLSQELFPVVDENSRMIGVLSKSDLIDPPRTRLALVDHNEYAQAVRGVEEAEIIEVIDHHRLAGDLVSREPIRYLNEPVGSTSTLVARKFLHRDLKPEPGVALCLCAGIISDTLNLTSPTTTELDHDMLGWLSKIAGVDRARFTEEFFAVGSLLATGTTEEILNADRKEFSDEGARITIAQVEELGLQSFDGRREELEAALEKLVEAEGYDLGVLVVTDISRHFSLILAAGQPAMCRALPFAKRDDTLFEAPGVVSRKKQVFPAVSQAVRRAGTVELS